MSEQSDTQTFFQQLAQWQTLGHISTDDLLGMVLPLVEQTAELHAQGLIAPLNGVDALSVSMGHLWFFNGDACDPRIQTAALKDIDVHDANSALAITGHYSEMRTDHGIATFNKHLAQRDEPARLAYYPDYCAWEEKCDHHDALTDVHVLGLIMASLATGLDFTDPESLAQFVNQRDDLSRLNPRLHPLVSKIITEMTALERHRRPQDLQTLLQTLRHYREQDQDTTNEDYLIEADGDQQAIQKHLRNKLFEISRRNRLLYFRDTGSSANLTLASVPHVLDYRNIRIEQLMLCNEYLVRTFSSDKPVALSRWLRFEDYPFLSNQLDKIRLQAGRDEKEYGFSQLRLVLAFFRWHNLKETPQERINSPLILVPAKVQKKKGVKDSYTLTADLSQAEINPVLRYQLQQVFDIRLPERIDATDASAIVNLHTHLQQQINQSARGVELTLVDRPRIQLIARKAKRKLDDFKRKRRITGRGISDYNGIPYSYNRDKFEPLGVQIFTRNVRLAEAPARDTIAAVNRSAVFKAMVDEETSVEQDFYAIDQGQQGGENHWELDLCSLTLANFSYRKMTLVGDYTELLQANNSGENFNALFSHKAKPVLQIDKQVALADQFHLLPADPSQSASVWTSRSNQSYVIQGPPGTGKSQTITNLIADYMARNKSVLFVCEKRVALDVVYHRLKQVGIEDLCALIHDSQGDKKAFIDDLETLYLRWQTTDHHKDDPHRSSLLADIATLLTELESFANAMQLPVYDAQENPDTSLDTPAEQDSSIAGPSLRQLLQRWVAAGGSNTQLTTQQRAQLPSLESYEKQRKILSHIIDSLNSTLSQSCGANSLAESPLWCLKGNLADSVNPEADLDNFCARIIQAWPETMSDAERLGQLLNLDNSSWQDLLTAHTLIKPLTPLILDDQVKLLDPDSIGAQKLKKHLALWQTLAEDAERTRALATGWQLDKVSLESVHNAAAAARDCEGKWWLFLSGRWRQAKQLVRDFGPKTFDSYTLTLQHAADALSAAEHFSEKQLALESQFGVDDLGAIAPILANAWRPPKTMLALERQIYRACIAEASNPELLAKIAQSNHLQSTEVELAGWLTAYQLKSPREIRAAIDALKGQGQLAYEVADLLVQLDNLDTPIGTTLRCLPLPLIDIENAITTETLNQKFRRNRTLSRFDGNRLQQLFGELDAKLAQLREANAEAITNTTRSKFLANIQRASGSMANTTQEEKDWRRAFNRGRKLLEREFEKSRAYKSIRELFTSEAGELLRNLKPVWMMSPLSVSDVLPLSETLFDVVIFDEASQIPLEDAVPTLYRARQMIVVGDEMQLPPSQFFASQSADDDEQTQNLHIYNLNADSFLNRASGALPTTLLSWHYRSRHESLIGFCNQAFYSGQLQTVPSTQSLLPQPPIVVNPSDSDDQSSGQTLAVEAQVYQRPISYHKLENSPYSQQRNTGEANYIAQLVRQLLLDQRRETVGIVAFSQAQQTEIEAALARLASDDKRFAEALEAEEEREDEDQFVGLFVKNLENVQGDERDIIILSVCYGPNIQGKMLMNFGPINQNGGEKRLNVIFSRAKKHMVVVTSIEASQITNTYNTGANALRQYLRYARAVSEGNTTGMQTALLEYGYSQPQQTQEDRALVQVIAERLRGVGLVVETGYGQSELTCDLAVRRKQDVHFRLGILTDSRQHYATEDLIERYHTPASVLQAFGWNICFVLAKDWYRDADAVIARILASLTDRES
ncbi:AAA domain-containing protein [Simiduia aestuariiviva]|uniref:DNA helicase n=1 Tax=Simiduia aestuariiviva TaxID=1510459 RepID=A0A839UUJ5_9GAMM|nr:AAA domain-containing protein [Simiduia aestuariiviva]MBB3169035.1 hypothetical protein [Simiduia aestuariiviva]